MAILSSSIWASAAGFARRRAAAIAGLLALLCLAGCLLVDTLVQQPRTFAFSHRLHAEISELECADCHPRWEDDEDPGMPRLAQCALCHSQLDAEKPPELQVETLFYGAAGAMRRQALRPIAAFMHGRDQRQVRLLDVACGTGRFLRAVRLAYPAMKLSGLDLSKPYLDEAQRHLKGLRPVDWIAANAEGIPLADASQDIVTTVLLFHELPPEVRNFSGALIEGRSARLSD